VSGHCIQSATSQIDHQKYDVHSEDILVLLFVLPVAHSPALMLAQGYSVQTIQRTPLSWVALSVATATSLSSDSLSSPSEDEDELPANRHCLDQTSLFPSWNRIASYALRANFLLGPAITRVFVFGCDA
jgi:hypothetical protein